MSIETGSKGETMYPDSTDELVRVLRLLEGAYHDGLSKEEQALNKGLREEICDILVERGVGLDELHHSDEAV